MSYEKKLEDATWRKTWIWGFEICKPSGRIILRTGHSETSFKYPVLTEYDVDDHDPQYLFDDIPGARQLIDKILEAMIQDKMVEILAYDVDGYPRVDGSSSGYVYDVNVAVD